MKRAFVAALLLLSPFAYGGGGPSIIIAVGHNSPGPAARMTLLADYVAIPINIQNDARDPVKRGDEIEKALRAIRERLAPHPDLKTMAGVISLAPREQSKLSSDFSLGGSAQFYILGALKEDTSIFAVTKRIYQIVAATPVSDGTKVSLGNTALGVEEPEKYRNQLLGLIAKSVAEARKSLGPVGSVDIDGLENPVTVMQLNDREIVLFINYRLRVQTKAT